MRFDLPPDVTPEEERAILAALERYFDAGAARPSPWALAGRAEGLRLGALQVRHRSEHPWKERLPFSQRVVDHRGGRSDRT